MTHTEIGGAVATRCPSMVIGSAFLAVLMLLILVLEQRSDLQAMEARVEATALAQLRSTARERLLGSELDLRTLSPEITEDVRVIWVFDPEECRSCALEINGWNRLVLGEYPSGLVILRKVEEADAHRTAERMGIRTAYVADGSSEFSKGNGLYFISSLVVLNRRGRVLWAEFNDGQSKCVRDILALARDLVGPEPVPSDRPER